LAQKTKGRYKGQKWTKISRSKDPKRRKKHEVKRYTMKCSKPYRIPAHVRRPRRTDEQIEKANERKRKKERKGKKTKKQQSKISKGK